MLTNILSIAFLAAANEENVSPTTQFSLLYSDFFGVRSGNDRDQGIDQQIITLVRELEMKYNYSVSTINLSSVKAELTVNFVCLIRL